MPRAIDTTSALTPAIVEALKDAGVGAVIKYISNTANFPSKRLTHVERSLLVEAGIKSGFVSEGLNIGVDYFSAAQGQSDAKLAIEYFNLLSVPPGQCCFATVDYDASLSDIEGPILDYIKAFHDTLKASGYLTGVYGSGLVCDEFKQMGYAHYAWLSQSESFAGTADYQGWDIKQTLGTFPGIDSDMNEVKDLSIFW